MEELLQEEQETEVIFVEENREEEAMWNRMNQVLLLHGRKPTPSNQE